MSSDFESYEQDFAVLTAEITGRIGKVPKLVGDEKKQMVANVEKQLEEARELLEQMELEVREIPPQSRGMYSSRMRSYKQEMGKLEADFKRSRIAYSDEVRNELLGDDGNSSENQLIKLREERAHLLDNTERLERSSRRLEAGYQIAVETAYEDRRATPRCSKCQILHSSRFFVVELGTKSGASRQTEPNEAPWLCRPLISQDRSYLLCSGTQCCGGWISV
ncbi:vesicle transport through interaction with t-SNAREs homolog 1A isoform X2 [Onychostruthus taczanowskii]|uniref:vesicle transport through interaction with t-SNAREs homolog 1A isoform X2 n=1 Tax=Onychostruthus taczanowskii TaxID=356909 RepID=UPI001B8083AB|nr:vesicle transport through interaction with t-SNAREs homolog 1A isoform X2 [Onychostruthus taczanowskii]